MVEYGDALLKGFKFAFWPKRWLPFFVIDLVFFSAMISFFLGNLLEIISILTLLSVNPLAVIGSFFYFFAVILGGIIIWSLVKLWVTGAIIWQAYREKEFKEGFRFSCKRYLSLFCAAVVITAINTGAGQIPYIGWLITIIFALIFFFALQGVMINKSGFYNALLDSWKIFRSRPLQVFLMWLLVVIISALIMAIFSIPAFVAFFTTIFPTLIQTMGIASSPAAFAALLFYLMNNIPLLVTIGVIFLVGTSISSVFTLKAQTEFYLQVKKKKLFSL